MTTWLKEYWRRWQIWRRRDEWEADLKEELRTHLEMRSAEVGAPAAYRQFGSSTQLLESSREIWLSRGLDRLGQDLHYAVRSLRKSPGFTALALLALALGIGANVAIFSVVNAVLLRALPYADAERLVVVLHGGSSPVAAANYLDWRAQAHSFTQLEAAGVWSPIADDGHRPEVVQALQLTPGMFSLLGVNPLYGRSLNARDIGSGADPVAVLSYRAAEQRFGNAAQAVGKALRLDGKSFLIVGVMPPDFRFAPFWATRAELWVPLDLFSKANDRRGQIWRVFGRLRDGVSVAAARAEMDIIARRLADQYPQENAGLDAQVIPLKEKVISGIRPTLLVLSGTVGCVLLIACVNLALLLLARANGKRREVALRAAVGAGQSRLVALLLTESTLLSLLGGGLGVALAYVGLAVLQKALPIAALPRQAELRVDTPVLLFAVLLSAITGLLAGLAPAWQVARTDLLETLKEGARGQSAGHARSRSRRWLLSAQAALAVALLLTAGLLLRSFARLQSIDPGFAPAHLLTMQISVLGTNQANRRETFYPALTQRLLAVPGVVSAAAINHLPLAGDTWGFSFRREGDPVPRPGEAKSAVYRVVQPGYYGTMQIPLTAGRDFTAGDRGDSLLVVIINAAMARQHWPGASPLGRRIVLNDPQHVTRWLTVVGIVKDVRQGEWSGTPRAELYLPLAQTEDYLQSPQSPFASLSYVVRTRGNPALLAGAVRQAAWSLDRHVPVSEVTTMEEIIANTLWRERLLLGLLGAFAVVALILAMAGIYAVVANAVTERTQELGIRLALGAKPAQVVCLALSEGMLPVVIGLAAGLGLARITAHWVESLLYGVRPSDPATIVSVLAVMIACALLANLLPARRILRLDPARVLRDG